MIIELSLKNFVLIDSLSLSFDKGFHIFTGETGAGKTLIVQAINLLTGQKITSDIIQKNSEQAVIEAAFDIKKLFEVHKELTSAGIKFNPIDNLIIRREVFHRKKNQIFINSQPASLSLLLKIGPLILSFVGQNDALSLKSLDEQRNIIDTFGNLHSDLSLFSKSYSHQKELERELDLFENSNPRNELQKLKWEYDEWVNFNYQKGEEEELFLEYKNLSTLNSEIEKLREIQACLDHSSILSSLHNSKKLADEQIKEHLNTAILSIQDASYLTSEKLNDIKANPNRYEEIEKRLSKLNALKKKYHIDTTDITSYIEKLKYQVDQLEEKDNHLIVLKKKIRALKETNLKLAKALSIKRKESGEMLCKKLSLELQQLNIPNVRIEIRIDQIDINFCGIDQVSIYLSTNKGEALTPLQNSVSGGEISRLYFVIALILSEKKSVPTLIVDEIDSNVGGETATLVGKKLQKIGLHTQVLAISHFPQVARFADRHFQITKFENDERTLTKIEQLEKEQIKDELLRMAGGYHILDV